MRTFVAIFALVGVVSADVSLGYRYNPPSSSYGVPAQSSSGGSSYQQHGGNYQAAQQSTVYQQNLQAPALPLYTASQSNSQASYQPAVSLTAQSTNSGYQASTGQYHTGQQQQSGSYAGSAHQSGSEYKSGSGHQSGSGYQSGGGNQYGSEHQTGSGYAGGHGNTHYAASSSSSSGTAQPSFQFSGSSSTVQGGFQSQSVPSTSQYQSSIVQKYQEYYKQQQQQPAQVFKHFYVHAAPEEPEQPKFRQPPVLPAPQKHYKIIFIKTPTPQSAAPQFIPIQQQNEEKTIVYVLVKKPEEAQDIVLPKIEQKPPTKPEVFFIKYNDKEGSQNVINNIVSGYNSNSQGATVSFSGAGSSESASIAASQGLIQAVKESDNSVGLSSSESAGTFGASVGSGDIQTGSSVASAGSNVGSASYDSNHVASQALSEVSQGSYSAGESHGASQASQANYSTGEAQTVSQFTPGSYTTGDVQSQQSYNLVSSSQGVPHESYGTPKFRQN